MGRYLPAAGFCTLLMATASLATQDQTETAIRSKLVALAEQVPNMLARPTLKTGQWLESEVQTKAADFGVNETSRFRSRITRVSPNEIAVENSYSGKTETEVRRRQPFYSRESIERGVRSIGKLTRFKITNVRQDPPEVIQIGSTSLSCGKVTIDIEFDVRVDNTDLLFAGVFTYWYHVSIPLDGIAQSVTDMRGRAVGNVVSVSINQKTLNYGNEW